MEIDESSGNTIGGTSAGASDVISGNNAAGVELDGASGNLVEGDAIGTDLTATNALGNANDGVKIDATYYGASTDNTIGGTAAVAGNLITYNGGPGVIVTGDSSLGNQITANRIFGNAGQAIDLGGDGVTLNGSSNRQGPNNLQNFPIVVMTANGQFQGWLGGSSPDSVFYLEFFASAGYGPDGAGEAEDYIGSMDVTTDSSGQATFDIPFAPPDALPVVTATATDSQGNTSEVSVQRRATFEAPVQTVGLVPGRSPIFSDISGDPIALEDPDAAPLDLKWDLSLSVGAGTLTLSGIAGLTGSGDGTGALDYQGTLSALNAALDGLSFTPPPGFDGATALRLNGASYNAMAVAAVVAMADPATFVVFTTADSGSGSLRQAILDSNATADSTNTIDFDILGQGVQTIEPLSPLPLITTRTLLDGSSQPGFTGTPSVGLSGQAAGNSDALAITGSDVSIRGLSINGFALGTDNLTDEFTVLGVPIQTNQSGNAAEIQSYRIDTSAGEQLMAMVHANGLTTRLCWKIRRVTCSWKATDSRPLMATT